MLSYIKPASTGLLIQTVGSSGFSYQTVGSSGVHAQEYSWKVPGGTLPLVELRLLQKGRWNSAFVGTPPSGLSPANQILLTKSWIPTTAEFCRWWNLTDGNCWIKKIPKSRITNWESSRHWPFSEGWWPYLSSYQLLHTLKGPLSAAGCTPIIFWLCSDNDGNRPYQT